MAIAQWSCGITFNGLTSGRSRCCSFRERSPACSVNQISQSSVSLRRYYLIRLPSRCFTWRHGLSINSVEGCCRSPVVNRRKESFAKVNNQLNSKCSLQPYDKGESLAVEGHNSFNLTPEFDEVNKNHASGINSSHDEFAGVPDSLPQSHNIKRELVMLSLPAVAGQAIDPLTQLMETAYIGRLGSIELASAGVSMTIFNNISKLFNMPLLSVATSFVAEDISKSTQRLHTPGEEGNDLKLLDSSGERPQLSSVSTALFLAVGIGIFEALALSLGSGFLLTLMGIPSDVILLCIQYFLALKTNEFYKLMRAMLPVGCSYMALRNIKLEMKYLLKIFMRAASPMRAPAQQFLLLRALGAPAFVVSLALQGIFRGFKDTKTPVFCLGFGNFTAILLFPLLMYYFRLGVSGAAISTVLSQYLVAVSMLWHLNRRAVLLPPRLGELQFGVYLKSGGFLIGRTLSVLLTMTLAASMAARQGPVAMAAHQICFQLWLAVSLLIDAPAASAQALIASYMSKGDYNSVRELTQFALKIGLGIGLSLAAVLGVSFSPLASLFTKDIEVLGVVRTGLLFVCCTQPINALAFIFDGLHYGVSDFPYAARSMMLVGVISSGFLLYAPKIFGLPGVWSGLTLFMGLRMVAGIFRILSKDGPWWFLHDDALRSKVVG